MAQSQLSGNAPVDKGDITQGAGQKFWNTIFARAKNSHAFKTDLIGDIALWNSLYEKNNELDATQLNAFRENFKYALKNQQEAFDYLAYIIKQMEDKDDIDFNSDFIDKDEIRLSQEIIDYDKTKVKEPKSGMDDFKVNQKDYIWSAVFTKDVNNYKTDYDAWVTAKSNDPNVIDSIFQAWSKINGWDDFKKHADATTAFNNWVVPTMKIEAEYDVVTPTWANWKVLWAKETHSTWTTNSGHFHTWLNSKKDGSGDYIAQFIGVYLNHPLGQARLALDVDDSYSIGEINTDINNAFNSKEWWLVKLYIDEIDVAPAEFNTWLTTYVVPAKRDITDVINNNYADIKSEVETIYKNSVADHLAGYKLWRDAISAVAQRTEYNTTAESNTKYDEYVRSV